VPESGGTVAHQDYTDGLAVLSVVQVPTASPVWALARRWLPRAERTEAGGVTAHRFVAAGGAAYVMEMDDAAVLVAGNVAPSVIEPVIRSLERR
jgi:hypothetical protein